jgi:hypothetical protein
MQHGTSDKAEPTSALVAVQESRVLEERNLQFTQAITIAVNSELANSVLFKL